MCKERELSRSRPGRLAEQGFAEMLQPMDTSSQERKAVSEEEHWQRRDTVTLRPEDSLPTDGIHADGFEDIGDYGVEFDDFDVGVFEEAMGE